MSVRSRTSSRSIEPPISPRRCSCSMSTRASSSALVMLARVSSRPIARLPQRSLEAPRVVLAAAHDEHEQERHGRGRECCSPNAEPQAHIGNRVEEHHSCHVASGNSRTLTIANASNGARASGYRAWWSDPPPGSRCALWGGSIEQPIQARRPPQRGDRSQALRPSAGTGLIGFQLTLSRWVPSCDGRGPSPLTAQPVLVCAGWHGRVEHPAQTGASTAGLSPLSSKVGGGSGRPRDARLSCSKQTRLEKTPGAEPLPPPGAQGRR